MITDKANTWQNLKYSVFNTAKELTPGISVSLLPSIQNSFNPLSCSSTSGCNGKPLKKKKTYEKTPVNGKNNSSDLSTATLIMSYDRCYTHFFHWVIKENPYISLLKLKYIPDTQKLLRS